jgi:hypothetical protein
MWRKTSRRRNPQVAEADSAITPIQRAQSFRAFDRAFLSAVMRFLEPEGSSPDENSAHGSCISLEGVGAIGPHF